MYGLRETSAVDALTVEASLSLPSLRRGLPHVVAGRGGLGRPIRWAHSGEVPSIAKLLKGGELLLTTGMGVGRTAAEQRKFMRKLVERRVAGVVIELGQVFSRLPTSLLEPAEEGGVPLIELHREVMFVEVTEEVHASVFSRQMAVLRRGDELHRRFTDLLLDGSGVPEIVAELAKTIGNPVVLEKRGEGVLYHAINRTPDADVLAAWTLIRDDPACEQRAMIRPVSGSSAQTWGSLAALPLDSPLDEFDQVAVECAVGLVALALLRTRQETLISTRQRGNFLYELMSGRTSSVEASARASALGFEHRAGLLLPAALIPTKPAPESAWSAVWRGFWDEMRSRSIPVLVGSRGVDEPTLVVLGLADAARRAGTIEVVVEALRRRIDQQAEMAEQTVIAVGSAADGWESLSGALQQTIEVAKLAMSAPSRPWYDADVTNLDSLMLRLRGDEHLRRFAAARLAPLIEHDRRRAAKLVPTLRVLCEQGWRKADAARVLHLNRQSLYPRLERIEELLGVDLERQDDRLAVELALRTHQGVATRT